MSFDEIKLDYGLAEDMVKTFQQSTEQLQDTLTELQNIATTLEEGALLGRAGKAYTEAIRGQLSPSLAKLIAKFQELEGDVVKAMDFMRQADSTSASKF